MSTLWHMGYFLITFFLWYYKRRLGWEPSNGWEVKKGARVSGFAWRRSSIERRGGKVHSEMTSVEDFLEGPMMMMSRNATTTGITIYSFFHTCITENSWSQLKYSRRTAASALRSLAILIVRSLFHNWSFRRRASTTSARRRDRVLDVASQPVIQRTDCCCDHVDCACCRATRPLWSCAEHA